MTTYTGSTESSQDGYKRVRITGKLITQKGLHVDFGSSAVRCAYFYNYGDGMLNHMIVFNDPHMTDEGEEIEGRDMEHTVDIYPFDDAEPGQEIYPGNITYHNRRAISAKYAFYPIVGMTDEMFQQYHLAKEIHQYATRDPAFKERLEQGIDALLFAVFTQAKVLVDHSGDRSSKGIDTLTATIPAQWTIEFEKYYGDRLYQAFLKVFNYPVDNILFHTEAQAGLQYMLYQGDRQAECNRVGMGDVINIGDEPNVVLLFDVGGHATNSALMSVCRDKDQKPFLLELEKDVGASGGTRAWEYEIIKKIKENYLFESGTELPTTVENDLRVCFYRNKTDIRANKPTILHTSQHRSCPTFFQLTWNETFQAWKNAYGPTISLIRNQLKKLKTLQSDYKVAKILVGGGSSQHRIFRDFLADECKVLEIGVQPFYMHRIGREYAYARLALGASYATTKTPSVKEFLDAASFGLRVEATWKTDDGQTMHGWSKDALLMWSEAEGSVDVYNTSTNGEAAEIICQANFAASKGTVYLPRRNPSYQIIRLPHLPHGKIHFRLILKPDEEDMTLILMGEIPTALSLSGMGEPKYPVLASVTFPVTVWAGCRALTIYDDHEEVMAKINNLLTTAAINSARVRTRMPPMTEEEEQQALAASTPGPSVASGSGSARRSGQARHKEEDVDMADA